jgi:hypothetical protein
MKARMWSSSSTWVCGDTIRTFEEVLVASLIRAGAYSRSVPPPNNIRKTTVWARMRWNRVEWLKGLFHENYAKKLYKQIF